MEAIRKKTRELNMTEGPLLGKILAFALPLMAANLLQTFYNAADMMVVSLSAEANAVGAIGATSSMINLVLNLCIGFSIGVNVVVARRLGAGEEKSVSRAVHSALIISVALGFAGMALGLLVSKPTLVLMGAQDNLLDLAVLYTRIYFAGLPFIALTNCAIAIFRAKGNTRTPLVILSLSGLLNVGLNLFFVLAVRLSVEGVGIATAASNAASATLLLWKLSKSDDACRFSFRLLRLDRKAIRDMLYVGIPASLQGALFSLSNLLIQSSILTVNNRTVPAGEAFQPVIKGDAAAANLERFSYTATNSIYQTSITFTSQNVGAGKYSRVWRVMGGCYLVTTVIALLFGEGTLLFRIPLLALYGVAPGEAGSLAEIAYHTAYTHMLYKMLLYFLLAWMEAGSGILRGLGKSLGSTVISLVGSCLLRIVWLATVFRAFGTLESIYISYPISWGLTAATYIICILVLLKKRSKENLGGGKPFSSREEKGFPPPTPHLSPKKE